MKKLSSYWIMILCIPLLCGCWSRKELNEIAIVSAISIDKAGDQYFLTVQVIDPGQVSTKYGGAGRAPVTTYNGKGKHLFEIVRKLTTITPRKLYFAHLQMLVISEEVAKDGINNILDFLTRDSEFRKDFYIVVSKNIKADEILKNLTSLEKLPAHKMKSSLETSQKVWAPTSAVQMDELIRSLVSKGDNPALTGIAIKGNVKKGQQMANVEKIEPYARMDYENIAVFKKDKLVGWLNQTESKGYNYIKNKVTNTVGDLPCGKDKEVLIEVIASKTKVKGNIINGHPRIDVYVNNEANIGEVTCHTDLTDPQNIKKFEIKLEHGLKAIIQASINKTKKLGVDIYGFGEVIHRKDPKIWKVLEKDWNQNFTHLPVGIHTKAKIRRTGTVNQSFLEKE